MDKKNGNNQYVERATDILVNLVRESRRKLPSPEQEANNVKKDLSSLNKFDKAFRENSKEIIDWIQKNRSIKK